MKKYLILTTVLLLILGTAACSNLGGDEDGELVMSLADKPVNGVEQVLVTIDEVQVKREDTEWTTLNDFSDEGGEKEFDLMDLRFDEELLGQEMLPTGNYEQIRLIVAADEAEDKEDGKPLTDKYSEKSKVVYEDGTTDEIFIPSGTQTGLKISHNFRIEENTITRLLLDADVSKIMHQTGENELILRPTAIDVVDEVVSGDIKGQVMVETEEGTETIADTVEDDVVVEVYENNEADADDSEPVKSTVALDKDEDEEAGTFLLRGLPEGTYSLKAYPADEDGAPTDEYETDIAEDIEVEAEEVNELENPLTLK
ncbi:MAG: DUF4382 domain-containing protein [Halanaerobiales bacterium]